MRKKITEENKTKQKKLLHKVQHPNIKLGYKKWWNKRNKNSNNRIFLNLKAKLIYCISYFKTIDGYDFFQLAFFYFSIKPPRYTNNSCILKKYSKEEQKGNIVYFSKPIINLRIFALNQLYSIIKWNFLKKVSLPGEGVLGSGTPIGPTPVQIHPGCNGPALAVHGQCLQLSTC